MDILFTKPYLDYVVISLVTIGLICLMRLGLRINDSPNSDPAGLIAARLKEQKNQENRETIKQMLEHKVSDSEPIIDGPKFSDLTVGDLKRLSKDFLFYCFITFLIIGIPYLAFHFGFILLESIIPNNNHSLLVWIASLGILVFLIVTLFKNPAYTLAWLSVLFRDMSISLSKLSHTKQIFLMTGIIGYLYLAFAYPYAWVILSVCLMPFEFTYGRYKAILNRKTDDRARI
ncbi:MAG: hypothetical protein AMXMBFR67_15640 [Nitrospira sp.]